MAETRGEMLERGLNMLSGEITDLRKLAQMSGLPVRTYFIGADLQNTNLRGQDLRDLSFEGADLRGADIRGVVFDEGALQGAKLDPPPSADAIAQPFTGMALTTFDARGRVPLLQPLRERLMDANQGEAVIRLAMHPSAPCLMGFGAGYLPETPDAIFPNFSDIELVRFDASGRFVVPARLRIQAGFDQTAFFSGAGDYFEIWAPHRLREYAETEAVPRYVELLERLDLVTENDPRFEREPAG